MTLLSVRGWRWLAWVVGAVVFAAVLAGSARGQGGTSAALPTSAQGVLTEMASHAGVIFTGEVVGITRADASGYVDVKFRVDQAVRGVSKTGAYVLREWAGLWTGGPERYRVGQRYLMLLTPRGSSGMSAPVGGTDGAIPLTAAGDSPLANGSGIAPVDKAVDAPEAQVDLRWLAARAVRATSPSGSAVTTGTGKTGSVRPRMSAGTAAAGGGGDSGAGGGAAVGGRAVAAPVTEPVDGGDGGAAGSGWAGAISPLAGAGVSTAAGSGAGAGYPVATKLSSILALLGSGNGSAHVSR